MYIEIAEKAGFCFGVERAIALAERAAERYGEVCTLGELIHNERAVAELERKGVRSVVNVSEAEGKPLIIRSHGVSRVVETEARKYASEVIDATCPFVKKIHNIVADLPENAKAIVLGDSNHPEVVGIMGSARCTADYLRPQQIFGVLPNSREKVRLR